MMKNLASAMTAATLTFLIDETRADRSFYCIIKESPDIARYGGVEMYRACGDACVCAVVELYCLVRDPLTPESEFTLES